METYGQRSVLGQETGTIDLTPVRTGPLIPMHFVSPVRAGLLTVRVKPDESLFFAPVSRPCAAKRLRALLTVHVKPDYFVRAGPLIPIHFPVRAGLLTVRGKQLDF